MNEALQTPQTIAQTVECVRSLSRAKVRGGGTKPAQSADATLTLAGLSGIVDYDPQEFTITALAGTPVAEIQAALEMNGQQLAFDPPLAPRGATIGGTVAAGLSGPGRFRSGGVRDFVLGVRAVSGDGRLFCGGGRVVKNSAGFDLPKLMVGSLGRFGVMVELTLKVFPRPHSRATACFSATEVIQAMGVAMAIADSKMDVECLDIDDHHRLWVRVAGYGASPTAQIEQLRQACVCESETYADDRSLWHEAREFAWAPEECDLVKASVAPTLAPQVADALGDVPWRISCGGHLLWIAWPRGKPQSELQRVLEQREISALALTGAWSSPLLGVHPGAEFARRLQSALDPTYKFAPMTPV